MQLIIFQRSFSIQQQKISHIFYQVRKFNVLVSYACTMTMHYTFLLLADCVGILGHVIFVRRMISFLVSSLCSVLTSHLKFFKGREQPTWVSEMQCTDGNMNPNRNRTRSLACWVTCCFSLQKICHRRWRWDTERTTN